VILERDFFSAFGYPLRIFAHKKTLSTLWANFGLRN